MNQVAAYSLTDPHVMENPYPFYAALHAENARVVPVDGVGYWVGRMADIRELSRNTQVFSNAYFGEAGPLPTGVNPEPLQADVQSIFDSGPAVTNALWTTDPPIHSQHRKLVNKAFTNRWVASQEVGIRTIATDLLGGFAQRGQCELIQDYCVPIPLLVIADALGVPRSDLAQFKAWSDDILAGNLDVLDHARRLQVAQSWVDTTRYFSRLIDLRRNRPGPDLISGLATAEVAGQRLSNAEILPIISTLLLAGNETTTNLIGNAVWRLLDEPHYMSQLRADPGLIPAFCEEVLRHDAPVQCLYRVTTQDALVGETTIPSGSMVMLGWGSAGHDPAVFDLPADFVLHRPNIKAHVAFGYGPHLCVGLQLARVEARIALEVLLQGLLDLQVATHYLPEHLPTFATRGLKRLDLTFTHAA